MGAQEFHLIGQYVASLEIDVFRMGRSKRNGQKLDACGFRGSAGLVVIAACAGGDHIVPVVRPTLTERAHMIPGEFAGAEVPPTV